MPIGCPCPQTSEEGNTVGAYRRSLPGCPRSKTLPSSRHRRPLRPSHRSARSPRGRRRADHVHQLASCRAAVVRAVRGWPALRVARARRNRAARRRRVRVAGRRSCRRRTGSSPAHSRNPPATGRSEGRPPGTDFTARHVPQRGSGGFRGDRDRTRMRGGNGNGSHGSSHGHGNVYGNGNRAGRSRFQSNRPSGQNRQPTGRAGGQGFRNGSGNGNGSGEAAAPEDKHRSCPTAIPIISLPAVSPSPAVHVWLPANARSLPNPAKLRLRPSGSASLVASFDNAAPRLRLGGA